MVIVAVALDGGTAPGTSETVNAPEPLPIAGATLSHDTLLNAVHESCPEPDCVSRMD
jgi:hypothetical protein